LPKLYSLAEFSLLPSIYEAVSLSGLESLACGTPVIGTNVGGIPEFIKNGKTGFLVEPKSSQAIADAANRMLDTPELLSQMRRDCREFVVSDFSWRSVAKKTIAYYESLR